MDCRPSGVRPARVIYTRAMAYVLFAAVCVIWGSSFILMKMAGPVFGAMTIGAGRSLGGAAALAAVWWVMAQGRRGADRGEARGMRRASSGPAWRGIRRGAPGLARRGWWKLGVPVFIGMAYPWAMQPYLIHKHSNSAFFGMMVGLVPLLTIAASVPMLAVYPKPRQAVGVLLGFGCMGLLIGVGREIGVPWYDVLLSASVPACYALSNTYIKRSLSQVEPIKLTTLALSGAGVVLLPLGMLTEPVTWTDATTGWWAVAALGVLGVVGTGLAMVMFYGLVQRLGPLFAGMVSYLVPMGALLWGGADNEPITASQVVALAGILAGVALVQWPMPRRAG